MGRIRLAIFATALGFTGQANAQSNEEKFHDLFVTAGYCTAFGAALGTAVLGLTDSPAENLQYVAVGASLGFIGGSVMGSYIIFAPGFVDNDSDEDAPGLLAESRHIPTGKVAIRPTWHRNDKRVSSLESAFTIMSF